MVSDINKRKRQSYCYLSAIYELIITNQYEEAMEIIATQYDEQSGWGTSMAGDSLLLLLRDKSLIQNEPETVNTTHNISA